MTAEKTMKWKRSQDNQGPPATAADDRRVFL